jgi:hypothetical protein
MSTTTASMRGYNYTDAIKANTAPQQGILTEQIISLYDVIEEKHIPSLISRYGQQFANLMTLFRSMGREEAISGIELVAHEENRIHDNFKVASDATSNTLKEELVITIDDDYVYSNNVYPRIGDIITLPASVNNEKQVIVTAVTGASKQITIKPIGNFAIGTIPAGTTLAITNGAFGAGTGQPKGTVVGSTPRWFQAQIFKETVGLQGSEFIKEKWYKAIDDGRSLPKWYTTGIERAQYLLDLKIDGALTVGDYNDTDLTQEADDGSNVELKTTRGMVPWVRDLGYVADGSSGVDMDMIDYISLYMKRQGVESGIALAIVGDKLMQNIERDTVNYLAGVGHTDYTKIEKTLFKGNRELSVSFNIKTITSGGLTIAFRPHGNWTNPVAFGSEGYNYDQYGIILPMTTVKDSKSGVKMPNVGVKYMAKDGYSRRFETWSVKGAGGGLYVTDIDRADFFLRSHIMFHFVKANQAVLIDPNYSGS